MGPAADSKFVKTTPTNNATYRTNVPRTIDSRVEKSLLSEKHLSWILTKNPNIQVSMSNIRFKPFSLDKIVPLIGCIEMRLTNNKGRTVKTTIYIVKGEEESLLGKQDGIKLS